MSVICLLVSVQTLEAKKKNYRSEYAKNNLGQKYFRIYSRSKKEMYCILKSAEGFFDFYLQPRKTGIPSRWYPLPKIKYSLECGK